MISAYLNHCIESVGQVDANALSDIEPHTEQGIGSMVKYHPLGSLPGGDYYGALKIPASNKYADAVGRVLKELSQIALHIEATPQITPYMPAFMGLIAVENTNFGAVIVEDVSRDGTVPVTPNFISPELRKMLYVPYQEEGEIEEVTGSFKDVAFDVNGEEKLLDFVPEPVNIDLFSMYGFKPIRALVDSIWANKEALTLKIPEGSPLGQSLHRL